VENNSIINNLGDVERALEDYVKSFPTVKDAAESLDVSRVFLWKMRKRKKPITETVLEKIGFEKVTTTRIEYVKKES
jgi:hypothetical protein